MPKRARGTWEALHSYLLGCVQGRPTHDQGGSLWLPWLVLLDIWCREQKCGVTWLFWTGEGPQERPGFSVSLLLST